MLKNTYDDQDCSIARALELIGERWTILIVRDAFLGKRRFEEFLAGLGVARTVLAERLRGLVAHGIMERVPYQDHPLRYEYLLTGMGRDLLPVLVSMTQWGARHAAGPDGPPREARHHGCGGPAVARLVCAECGRPLDRNEVAMVAHRDRPAAQAVTKA